MIGGRLRWNEQPRSECSGLVWNPTQQKDLPSCNGQSTPHHFALRIRQDFGQRSLSLSVQNRDESIHSPASDGSTEGLLAISLFFEVFLDQEQKNLTDQSLLQSGHQEDRYLVKPCTKMTRHGCLIGTNERPNSHFVGHESNQKKQNSSLESAWSPLSALAVSSTNWQGAVSPFPQQLSSLPYLACLFSMFLNEIVKIVSHLQHEIAKMTPLPYNLGARQTTCHGVFARQGCHFYRFVF